MSATEITAYAQAAESGRYDRVTGLQGKYDNVRVHWEDQSLRLGLRPHLGVLVRRRRDAGRLLRVADLGCGSGDGFETLMSIQPADASAARSNINLLTPENVERYVGVELNAALLEQARQRHGGVAWAEFLQADLRAGLPFAEGTPPFDVYFASFGTLSHLGEEDTVRLLAEIARHADDGALILVDWLGRYAYEWTDLWNDDLAREHWMDYRISYIYAPEERARREIDSFPLRLLAADEARRVFARVEEQTGRALVDKALFDRSMFVGRHMETAEYNPHARPLRSVVNRLHEPLCRTELDDLLFELHVPDRFASLAEPLRAVHVAWNALVRYVAEALTCVDAGKPLPQIPRTAPELARSAMERMRTAIDVRNAIEADDARSEWIEPQLALALRNIELAGQRGTGLGHGLVAIYEVRKA